MADSVLWVRCLTGVSFQGGCSLPAGLDSRGRGRFKGLAAFGIGGTQTVGLAHPSRYASITGLLS